MPGRMPAMDDRSWHGGLSSGAVCDLIELGLQFSTRLEGGFDDDGSEFGGIHMVKRAGDPQKQTVVGQVQSLTRGLLLLECLAEVEDGTTLSDLAMQAGLAASTTHRLLNTLERKRFVYQDESRGRWFVGVNAFYVGNAFLNGRDVVAQARPVLRTLMEDSGETANLAVVDDGEAVMLAQAQSHEMMRMMVPLGSRSPLHASGVGKALLAAMSSTDIAAVLHKHGLPQITEHTVRSPAVLRETLAEVRIRGWAFDDEEHAVGLRCVAATVHDEHGDALAAISVSGPRSRITDQRVSEFGGKVASAAAKLTRTIGGKPPDWTRE